MSGEDLTAWLSRTPELFAFAIVINRRRPIRDLVASEALCRVEHNCLAAPARQRAYSDFISPKLLGQILESRERYMIVGTPEG